MGYIIVAAVALVLIFEGFLPFVAPKLWRCVVRSLADQSDRALHIMGFISMLIGVLLLFLTHHYLL